MASNSNEHDLRERVRGVIATNAPLRGRPVVPSAMLASDLGFDSLGVIELMIALEHELGIAAGDEDAAPHVMVVGDVEDLIVAAAALTRGATARSA